MGFYVHLLVLSLAVLGVRGQIKFPTGCPIGFFSVNGITSCFKLINESMSWSDGKVRCNSENLELARPQQNIISNDESIPKALELRTHLLDTFGPGLTWIGARETGMSLSWLVDMSPVNPDLVFISPRESIRNKCLILDATEYYVSKRPSTPYALNLCSQPGRILCQDTMNVPDTTIVPNTMPACKAGFEWVPIEKRCMDIDECAMKIDGCKYTCMNTKGWFKCGCAPGYKLNDVGDCIGCDTGSKFGMEGVKPKVHMRDIENTIAYTLRNQAPYTINGAAHPNSSDYKTLTKSQQEALLTFINALVNHLPLRDTLAIFLKCVAYRLKETSGCIPGEKLEEIYIYCTEVGGELPLVQEWVGCQNFHGNASLQQFRSYPCGVWTTFHAMTVNLEQSNQQEVSSLLPTLFGLVLYFPWCDMCRDNFITMYIDSNGECMETAEEVTMWLWRAHNIVTNRVAGFESKSGRSHLQFPSAEQCLSCCRGCKIYNSKECSEFNLPEVYSYLKTIYTPPFH